MQRLELGERRRSAPRRRRSTPRLRRWNSDGQALRSRAGTASAARSTSSAARRRTRSSRRWSSALVVSSTTAVSAASSQPRLSTICRAPPSCAVVRPAPPTGTESVDHVRAPVAPREPAAAHPDDLRSVLRLDAAPRAGRTCRSRGAVARLIRQVADGLPVPECRRPRGRVPRAVSPASRRASAARAIRATDCPWLRWWASSTRSTGSSRAPGARAGTCAAAPCSRRRSAGPRSPYSVSRTRSWTNA